MSIANGCKLPVWANWLSCSVSCGGGIRMRVRRINQHVEFGGSVCEGDLRTVESCNMLQCGVPAPCQFADWTAWTGGCAGASGQRTRFRTIGEFARNGS